MRINTVTPPDILTAGQHFARVGVADINRSVFDRSHSHKTTFDAGYLIPIFRDIVVPGDTINLNISALCRLATPIKPVMDRLWMDIHCWAVPIRLLWDHWPNFMGERKPTPSSSIDYVTPKLEMSGWPVAAGSLHNHFGFPIFTAQAAASSNERWHALYHRAYNKTWNEQYRDQNFQDMAPEFTGDGPDDIGDYVLLRRGKRHDYFTSATPEPQKGNAVTFSLAGFAPVTGDIAAFTGPSAQYKLPIDLDGVGQRRAAVDNSVSNPVAQLLINVPGSGSNDTEINPILTPNVLSFATQPLINGEADLTGVSAISLNEFRIGAATQQVLERDMRGGTRLTEIIKSHYGVSSPDGRMQRPELLGAFTLGVNFMQVEQTSVSAATPQGNLSAWAAAAGSGYNIVQSFTEHCVIFAVASVRADYTYQYGIRRDFRYSTRFDFMLPAFANLGEQGIRNEEMFVTNNNANNDIVWGYQERWAEMRYMPSQVSGLFASNAPSSIDVWHLAEEFAALPPLNDDFVQENPPIDRVIAVPSEPHFIGEFWFNYRHVRPLPVFSVPGLDKI